MLQETTQYDVAVSFAGEDRGYVEQVVTELKKSGVSVFYDKDNEIEMWGRDLLPYLQEIYGEGKARYCIIFVSKHYHLKDYTKFELKNVTAYALSKQGYILPVKLDDTELPIGVVKTTAYINASKLSPKELTQKIVVKVSKVRVLKAEKRSIETQSFKKPRIPKSDFDPYQETEEIVSFLKEGLKLRSKTLGEYGVKTTVAERSGRHIFRALKGEEVLYGLDI